MAANVEMGLLESVLFLESEPIDVGQLVRITGLPRATVLKNLESLKMEFRDGNHGIELIELAGGYTFAPKREYWNVLKPRYGRANEGKLSRAALETLSIVAYSQPITKPEIESIRGVSADGMLRLLLERKLIKEVGKKDAPGKPIQFGTSREFLKLFRLSSIADLPKLDELDKDRFETE